MYFETADIVSYRIEFGKNSYARGHWYINTGTETQPLEFYCAKGSTLVSPDCSQYNYASSLTIATTCDSWVWINGGQWDEFTRNVTIGSSDYAGHLIIGNDRGVDTLFKIIGGCLHRCRVFETEKNGYIFFDVHHTLFDGTSLKVFMQNVGKAFMGMQPDPDLYYLILQNREEEANTAFYEESRRYFEERFENIEWSSYPEPDHESRENEMGELFAPIGIEQPQMKAVERHYRISRNEFFIAVAVLAISIYNKKDDIKLSWIYNGREDMLAMNSVGLLFRDLPVGVRLRDDMTLRDLFSDIHDQVQKGIEHSCYPYVDIHNQAGGNESAYLLYQQDIRDMGGLDEMDIETIDIRQNQAASQTMLDMEILDGADGLELMIDYTASLYDDESMESFKDIFIRVAQGLVTHNSQTDVTVGELRKKYNNKKNVFETIIGIFGRKR